MLKINLKPSEWLKIGVLILVFVVGSTAAYQILQPKPRLPIYNPSDLNLPWTMTLERRRGHRIGDFALIDQWGNKADSSLLQGKSMWPTSFSRLSNHLYRHGSELSAHTGSLQGRGTLHLVLHGDAEIDTVEVVHAYGERMGAIKANGIY